MNKSYIAEEITLIIRNILKKEYKLILCSLNSNSILKHFPNIPISHGICFVFFMYLNKFIVKVKRDILTFFVQPCLSPFQLDRGLMTHIKLKSFKHEWIYLKVEFDFRLHLLKTYFIFLQLKFIWFDDAHILNLICLFIF